MMLSLLRAVLLAAFLLHAHAQVPNAQTSVSTGTHKNGKGLNINVIGLSKPDRKHTAIDKDSVLSIIRSRRIDAFVGSLADMYYLANPADIDAWLSSLSSAGKWPDSEVDYTSGCPARRANWPAQIHWVRILMMSAAWHGGVPGIDTKYVKDQKLRDAIHSAMGWWFDNDIRYINENCLDDGGATPCPCGTGGLWNTNWFSNMILIPRLVGRACLFLDDSLTEGEIDFCSHITLRSFAKFYTSKYPGEVSGANALDLAAIGIDGALQGLNTSVIPDAYKRVHDQMTLQSSPQADGLYPDGSFAQHAGVLYNGNYGKDYARAVLDLESASVGTEYASSKSQQDAFGTIFSGDSWVIVKNIVTGVYHWDLSVIGRFITFPVADQQASGSIQLNLTQIGQLGKNWGSKVLTDFATSLSKNASNANAGSLTGNHMFYAGDYMAHRGKKYVTTVKMFSKRTKNSECLNTQNPKGFHLSDGTVYTYQNGNEYEDIAAAWDWERIPGITVNRGGTALSCDKTAFVGVEAFVGGVSNGQVGAAAMRYTNPNTNAFKFQKGWFFLDDDVQVTLVSGVTSGSSISSILDQKKHSGQVLIDGKVMQGNDAKVTGAKTLWHDNVGYSFLQSKGIASLSVNTGKKTGNWSLIGTSTQPPVTVDLFSAWLDHSTTSSPFAYLTYPATKYDAFVMKHRLSSLSVQVAKNDNNVAAVYDGARRKLYAVFWGASGGSVQVTVDGSALTLASTKNSAVIYSLDSGTITASDPSQTLSSFQVKVTHSGTTKTVTVNVPRGGLAGSSVTVRVY